MTASFPPVGSIVDNRYRLVSLLGTAPGGHVMAAKEEVRSEELTLRIVSPEYAPNFAGYAENALRMAQERLAGVVPVHKACSGPLPYLVMSQFRGESMIRLLRNGPVPWDRAVSYVEACAHILARAHEKGYVHGALRTGCIYVERASADVPVVQIFDFRAADLLSVQQGDKQTKILGLGLAPDYSSPEQIWGTPAHPVSDVYSLGVILFELLTGRLPFVGHRNQISYGHTKLALPKMDSVAPQCQIPEEVESIAVQAMNKNRDQRFGSMRAFATALSHFRSEDFVFQNVATILVPRLTPRVPQLDPPPEPHLLGPKLLTETTSTAKREPSTAAVEPQVATARTPREVTAIVPRPADGEEQPPEQPHAPPNPPITAVVAKGSPEPERPITRVLDRGQIIPPGPTRPAPRAASQVRGPVSAQVPVLPGWERRLQIFLYVMVALSMLVGILLVRQLIMS